jgi:hypothetical protein
MKLADDIAWDRCANLGALHLGLLACVIVRQARSIARGQGTVEPLMELIKNSLDGGAVGLFLFQWGLLAATPPEAIASWHLMEWPSPSCAHAVV